MKWVIIVFLTVLGVNLHAQAKEGVRPNIIWIVCEDISPFIHAYGDKVVKTPNIDQLAKEGVKYNLAFTTAGVCAPSRSSIITGMYQTSIGTQHMRTKGPTEFMPPGVPNYSAVIPSYVKCFPEYLRMAGYYTTNNEKQDYQFDAPVTVWDENGAAASYQHRPVDKPFFAVFNLFITHESQLGSTDSLVVDPSQVEVPPFYPDTEKVRRDIARNLTNIQVMDRQVGEVIRQLKDDGVYDDAFIFFYSDHGGALPWMKREILERGIHIPLIIKMPGGINAGTENNELISSVDFAPTILSLAGVNIPEHMQGQAFLGNQKANTPRQYIFAARDRMDELYDRVRTVRDKQFQYLYNYRPELPAYQDVVYRRERVPMMKEILALRDEGKLHPDALRWFEAPKSIEELYDVENDPHQLHNLAADPKYASKLEELRVALRTWKEQTGDQSEIAEKDQVAQWWDNHDKPPVTATPTIMKSGKGVAIHCDTNGASIGYRIIKAGLQDEGIKRIIKTWDGGFVSGSKKNGTEMIVAPPWEVYKEGEIIPLDKRDKLIINAMRIGFDPVVTEYAGD